MRHDRPFATGQPASEAGGALAGVRIVELAGLGPGPFAGMLLSDMGADVIRVDRPDPILSTLGQPRAREAMLRNRKSITIDLRRPEGRDLALRLVDDADVLIEGFRPGVSERLGLGPDTCLARNPRLIYGRMTGWGQHGPLAGAAGHDINYIGLSGALHGVGLAGERPVPPIVLAGDTGGGGTYLALGICAALVECASSGSGQVIDAAIVDGSASLMSPVYGAYASGTWADDRGVNQIDGGAPYYRTYRCADDRYVAVGAMEDRFFAALVTGLGYPPDQFPDRRSRHRWPAIAAEFERIFLTRTRDAWCAAFDDTDACVTPVLGLEEAPRHRANEDRDVFVDMAGTPVPAPAPRFVRTPSAIRRPPVEPGTDTSEILCSLGLTSEEIAHLHDAGVVGGDRTSQSRGDTDD